MITVIAFDKVLNIDHHDKTKDSIKATLSIIDTKASSTCEMIATYLKAKEIISLLKEYLPKYKETLDLYYIWNLEYNNEDGHMAETNFIINIE